MEYDTVGCGTCGPTARPKTITFDRGELNFFYDPTSGLLNALTAPRQTDGGQAGGNTLSYTYDGSLPKTVQWSGEVAGTVGVTYDNPSHRLGDETRSRFDFVETDNFRVTSQSVNGSNTVNYQYDQDGLLTKAGEMTITRDPANGRITSTHLGNVTTSQTYNGAGELESYQAKFGSNVLFETHYVRDSLGRITDLTETVQGTTNVMRYGYDIDGRLEKVWRNDALISQYTYDGNGNRLSHMSVTGTVTGTYDAQDRLLSYGAASYVYTANGELQAKIEPASGGEGSDTTWYSYDAFGNLVQVRMPRQKDGGQANGDVIEYVVDAQNRRVGKKLNGTLVKGWLYEGQLRPVAELDAAGNATARYVYGAKVNVPEYIIKGSVTYRVITDHLGSVRLVVDQASGTVAQRMEYDEWGNVLADSNPDLTPFGFAGGLRDSQTGTTRFGERDYDPVVGRWMAKDPTASFAQNNVYVYCEDEPISSVDPSGLQSSKVKVVGGTEMDRSTVEAGLRRVLNTARGRELESRIEEPVTITIVQNPAETQSECSGTKIRINLEEHRIIPTEWGWMVPSVDQAIIHEHGPVLGGQGDETKIVIANENPIARELGWPSATGHESRKKEWPYLYSGRR